MKRNILIIACFFVVSSVMAQLPDRVKVGLPKILTKKLISEADVNKIGPAHNWGQNEGDRTNRFWGVRSDRDNNTTYKGPNFSSGPKDQLNFGEYVRIAEIRNNFAHVYQEAQEHRPYPEIMQGTDRGWVPMKHLLLWDQCPANEKGILNKALIVVNLDSKGNAKDLFKVYKNPSTKSSGGFATSSINFYFVMKYDEETKMALLSREAAIKTASEDLLYGWFSQESYVKWNQRSCLEPNWDKDEIARFNSRNDKLMVYEKGDFTGREIINPFKFGSMVNKDGREIDRYRLPKGSLRYPILDMNNQTNEKNYYCNVFAANGNLTDAAKYNQEIVKRMESSIKDVQSVNLIIAIDGTRSMEPFYSPVKDAIKQGYNSFKKENCEVKIGIVIYRDYKDGQYLTEVLPLTKHNDPRISEFLDKGGDGKYGIKSAPGDDVPEALFEGLKVATDRQQMKFSDDESNLLLVVGDCGNRLNDKKSPTQDEITQRLIKNNFQVVAFQVRRMNQQPYNWFQDQMGKLIVNNIKGQIDKLNKKELKVGWRPTPDGYELNSELAERYYIGSLLRPKLGEDMKVSRLSKDIQETLGKFSKAISAQRNLFYSPQLGNAKDSMEASFDEAFLEAKVGKEYVEFVKKTNSIMSVSGYTPRTDAAGYAYWKTVIYISSRELDELLDKLHGVYNAAKTSDYSNREPYVRAFKGVIKAMIPEKSDEEMSAMSQDEIMNEIAGLNARTETTQKYSLQNILNPKVVDNATYADIIRDFAEKYENLKRIQTSQYEFCLKVRNNLYYWIPTDMIP